MSCQLHPNLVYAVFLDPCRVALGIPLGPVTAITAYIQCPLMSTAWLISAAKIITGETMSPHDLRPLSLSIPYVQGFFSGIVFSPIQTTLGIETVQEWELELYST